MTWLWLIFSSLLAGATACAATVTGHVSVTSQSSRSSRTHDSGVVVWLEPQEGTSVPQARPAMVQMVQRKKEFQPHILAVPVGTTVDFPNADPIFHNAFSNDPAQPFDVGLYPPGGTRRVTFKRPGIIRVFCNIHQSMSAVVVVQRTPYLSVTNASGAFSIENVPPGDYTMHVFYERATPKILDELSRAVHVGDGNVSIPAFTVSEAGYIAVPHKNKYGRDYPPEAADSPGYSPRRP